MGRRVGDVCFPEWGSGDFRITSCPLAHRSDSLSSVSLSIIFLVCVLTRPPLAVADKPALWQYWQTFQRYMQTEYNNQPSPSSRHPISQVEEPEAQEDPALTQNVLATPFFL